MSFDPYLFFAGNCREAFTEYQRIFGGELQLITFADMPDDQPVGTDQADKIAHAALMSDGGLLMGSDDPTTDDFGPVQGMMVSLSVGDVAEAERVFQALAAGGEVRMEIAATSWSPGFGMCVDRFGTPWMVGVSTDAQPS